MLSLQELFAEAFFGSCTMTHAVTPPTRVGSVVLAVPALPPGLPLLCFRIGAFAHDSGFRIRFVMVSSLPVSGSVSASSQSSSTPHSWKAHGEYGQTREGVTVPSAETLWLRCSLAWQPQIGHPIAGSCLGGLEWIVTMHHSPAPGVSWPGGAFVKCSLLISL